MTAYAALDVSRKSTSIHVVDEKGTCLWRGKALTDPDALSETLAPFAADLALVGLETGCWTTWLWHGLQERGLPVVCMDARQAHAEIRKRAYGRYRSARGLTWHVDETYLRVNGRWCYLWRAVDQHGQLIDFRLTARRTASAARAFLRQARDTVRLYQPMTIVTDKAHSYAKVIGEWNARLGPDAAIRHSPASMQTTGSRAITPSQASPPPDAGLAEPVHGESHTEGRRNVSRHPPRRFRGLRGRRAERDPLRAQPVR